MEANYAFTGEEMAVNEHLGYPKAHGMLCEANYAFTETGGHRGGKWKEVPRKR